MVGDSDRDIQAAEKLGIRALRVRKPWEEKGFALEGLNAAVPIILNYK
jgi:histidinol phosphatase-like enzyme